MSRYRGPRLRIVRRLGELPGLTKKISKRISLPGQHGTSQKKTSQYGIRLQEKQKLRYNYGINERQLIRYVRQARKKKGSTGEILLQLLEMRLDNIVFRLGLVSTIAAARQAIIHGHFLVNDKRIDIPSYCCQPNDEIKIASRKTSLDLIKNFLKDSVTTQSSPHLTFDKTNLTGTIKSIVDRQSVGIVLNELLIVEYYSRTI